MMAGGQQRPNVPQQHQQQQRGPGMSALEAQLNKPPTQMPGGAAGPSNPGMKNDLLNLFKNLMFLLFCV